MYINYKKIGSKITTENNMKTFDVNDPIFASLVHRTKYLLAEKRLAAKEVFKKQGGDFKEFNELSSYAFYVFNREDTVCVQIHTSPIRITNKIERRKLYMRGCSYSEVCPDVIPFKPNVGTTYLVANYGSNETKIVNLSEEYKPSPISYDKASGKLKNPSKEVLAEMALLEHECRPVRSQPTRKSNLKRKLKTNLVREAVREIIPYSNSSCDEQSDTDKSNTSSGTEEGRKPRNKPCAKKSKHQGKAKTFKRKTQRGVRV